MASGICLGNIVRYTVNLIVVEIQGHITICLDVGKLICKWQQFITVPSEQLLKQFTKGQLLKLANYYDTESGDSENRPIKEALRVFSIWQPAARISSIATPAFSSFLCHLFSCHKFYFGVV